MILDDIPLENLRALDALLLVVGTWTVYKLLRTWRSRAKLTKLPGPPAESWLFGLGKKIFTEDSGILIEKWSKEYGPVFQYSGALGVRRTVIMDPKALTHFFSKQGYEYVNSSFSKRAISNLVSL